MKYRPRNVKSRVAKRQAKIIYIFFSYFALQQRKQNHAQADLYLSRQCWSVSSTASPSAVRCSQYLHNSLSILLMLSHRV